MMEQLAERRMACEEAVGDLEDDSEDDEEEVCVIISFPV